MRNFLIILFVFVAGSTVNAQKVQVGSDPAVDLSNYKTYNWTKGAQAPNPLINQIIVTAVDNELAAKGLRRVENDPELIVVAWASTESELYISKPSWSPSLNSINTGIAVGSQTWPVTKGSLVIDILEPTTKNSMWRATATQTLDHGPTGNKSKDAKSVEKPIQKAVRKMFKQFPRPSRK